jgi:hypothetical protein
MQLIKSSNGEAGSNCTHKHDALLFLQHRLQRQCAVLTERARVQSTIQQSFCFMAASEPGRTSPPELLLRLWHHQPPLLLLHHRLLLLLRPQLQWFQHLQQIRQANELHHHSCYKELDQEADWSLKLEL